MDAEDRARYSSKTSAGPVVGPGGRHSFPVPDAAHVQKAKRAIGRAPASERPAIKAKIDTAAKKFGLPPIGKSKPAPGFHTDRYK